MKRLCEPSDSSGSCEKKIKLSQSELQMLVEEEVQKAVQKNNNSLQVLAETIQQLQRDMDYEGSIQKLEERFGRIRRRAEKALTALQAKKKPSFSDDEDIITIDCDDEYVPQKKRLSRTKKKQVHENNNVSDTTQNTLKEFNKKTHDLSAIIRALEELCKTQSSTPKSKPQTMQMNKEYVLPSNSEDTNPQQSESLYPPLPVNPFPPKLSMEAVAYSIPQKVTVHLALVDQPASFIVMWNGEENEVSLPPMESYSVFVTVEKVKGSGIFPAWKLLGNAIAESLPMFVRITKYTPGHKLCVAVVGKDIYGRYGPYSDVVVAVLPE